MPHTFPISDSQYSRDKACNAILSAPDGHIAVFTRKVHLKDNALRERAMALVGALKSGWVLKVIQNNRTLEQNQKLWPMLTDLSVQKPLGRSYTPEQWKAVMMRACGHEIGYLNDVNGEPFPIGYRSSKLKVREMSDLIEYIYSFGAEHNITWSKPQNIAAHKAA